jgi:hypothetical protein
MKLNQTDYSKNFNMDKEGNIVHNLNQIPHNLNQISHNLIQFPYNVNQINEIDDMYYSEKYKDLFSMDKLVDDLNELKPISMKPIPYQFAAQLPIPPKFDFDCKDELIKNQYRMYTRFPIHQQPVSLIQIPISPIKIKLKWYTRLYSNIQSMLMYPIHVFKVIKNIIKIKNK